MDDLGALVDAIIRLANWSLPFLPVPLWQAALIVAAAVWVLKMVRAYRSGK
jgi:hypothetical protein